MPIKIHKPVTKGRRLSSVDAFADITTNEPEKTLIYAKKRASGRNAQGKITVRHRGGGAHRYVRIVDFKQDKYDIPAKVASIEYDPARGARLALLHYKDGEKRYMVAPQGVGVGDSILSSKTLIEIKPGNRMPLAQIPVGVQVHNIELTPGSGGMVARGAGLGAAYMALEGEYAQLKLPSGEVRRFSKNCMATVGVVGNADRRLIRWGKAGRTRHRGRRPEVRGKVMNPVDHPHGGGEGKHPVGLKYPKTLWGKHALGVKTRDRKKSSWKMIVTRRK
jgi:large subunit ribosomal protein L2